MHWRLVWNLLFDAFLTNTGQSDIFLQELCRFLQWRKKLGFMEGGSSFPVLGLIFLFLLLWLNGIFFGFSSAIKNISENEIRKMAEDGNKKALLLMQLIEHPIQYMNAMPVIMTASGILTGTCFVPWAMKTFYPYIQHWIALIFVTVISIIILAAFGILTFIRIGTCHSQKYALRYVKMVHSMSRCLYPVTCMITWTARVAAIPFGVDYHQQEDAVTEEEIISIVDEAHEQGVIEENEAEMIQNIISFHETDASEIMTHRKNVIAFSQELLLKEVVDAMMEEGNSRYPVYNEDINDIVGIIHYKDAMKFLTRNSWSKFKPLKELPGLIRTAAFIPETRSIDDLFHTMQAKKLHMVIVVDEYGQTAGIVSMEDILEEIVGEIQDEYDEDEIMIRTQIDNSILIDGFAYIGDVEEKLNIDFGELVFETLNGYLTSLLGHIPTEKDLDTELVANGYRFKILSLGNKTIDKVRAEKINEKEHTKGEKKQCQDIQNLQT